MKSIFKDWVPEWFIKLVLFSSLMPSMVLFFLPSANLNVTAGYYGCQPSDAQFLVILFYGGFVGFYILERRFFSFFPVKQYYILFNLLQILNCILMYVIRDITWIYPLRFLQGMLFASAVNLSISMIFSRLKSDSAREGSYSVFFGLLLCSSPFNNFVTADFIDSFNFDELYLYAAISFVPGLLLVLLTMRSISHTKPYPLFSLDWGSCLLYSGLIISFGYMMDFGQEVYWFHDLYMRLALLAFVLFLALFVLRQYSLKRVYIDLSIFTNRSLLLGMVILYLMYIERFSLGISTQYFQQVLHLDPIHISYIQLFNVGGIVCGVMFSMYWLLAQRSVKWIWTLGFISLLTFHQVMYFSFEGEGNDYYFWIPLVIHGLGVGLIMVPTILFVVTSVKPTLGVSAAAVCLAIRYLGYTTSIALQNFFKLFENSIHKMVFSGHLEDGNSILQNNLTAGAANLAKNGLLYNEQKGAVKLIMQRLENQSFIRYAMDYYEIMSIISLCVLLLIFCSPSLKTVYKKIRKNMVSPA